MSDQILVYARVLLVLAAAGLVGFVLVSHQPDATVAIGLILSTLGGLLAYLQTQVTHNAMKAWRDEAGGGPPPPRG